MFKMIQGRWWTLIFDMCDWALSVRFVYYYVADWRFEVQIGPVQASIHSLDT